MMPPATKKSRMYEPGKLERPSHLGKSLFSDILESQQQTEEASISGCLADTVLICNGGTVKVHAFLLQMASPFFQEAIASQGVNYPFIREVLLPDFSVEEIERMLTFVYKGYVDLDNEEQVQSLEETLRFFGIKGAVSVPVTTGTTSGGGVERFQGSVKVHKLNRIPLDIFKAEHPNCEDLPEEEEEDEPGGGGGGGGDGVGSNKADSSEDEEDEPPTDIIIPAAALAPRRQVEERVLRAPAAGRKKYNDDPDFEADSNNESSDDDDEDENGRRTNIPPIKSKLTEKKNVHQPVVNKRNLISPSGSGATPGPSSSVSNGSASTTNPSTKSFNKSSELIKSPPVINLSEEWEEDWESDDEDEDRDWAPPNYKDTSWFASEAKRCQRCNKEYEKHGDALRCITSKHKANRCYFCFGVYSNTESLYRHFAKRHKQAVGRGKTLMCHYCDAVVPYMAVSNHVISVHLKTPKQEDDDNNDTIRVSNTPPRPGRPLSSTIAATSTSSSGSGSTTSSASRPSRRTSTCSRSQSPVEEVEEEEETTKARKRANRGQESADSRAARPSRKKAKKVENTNANYQLKLEDLDVTVESVTRSGQIMTFRIHKCRHHLQSSGGSK